MSTPNPPLLPAADIEPKPAIDDKDPKTYVTIKGNDGSTIVGATSMMRRKIPAVDNWLRGLYKNAPPANEGMTLLCNVSRHHLEAYTLFLGERYPETHEISLQQIGMVVEACSYLRCPTVLDCLHDSVMDRLSLPLDDPLRLDSWDVFKIAAKQDDPPLAKLAIRGFRHSTNEGLTHLVLQKHQFWKGVTSEWAFALISARYKDGHVDEEPEEGDDLDEHYYVENRWSEVADAFDPWSVGGT